MWGIETSSRCFKVPHTGHLLSICCAAFALLALGAFNASDANAQHILINNGLAPPNPDNVIDAPPTPATDLFLVRNVDCPPSGSTAWDLCPSPGAQTQAEIVDGAVFGGGSLGSTPGSENAVRDSSIATMSGGTVLGLSTRESARLTVSGGTIDQLKAFDNSMLTITGGEVRAFLQVWDDATLNIRGGTLTNTSNAVVSGSTVPVTISGGSIGNLFGGPTSAGFLVQGSNFEIDGVPAGYGDYPASGTDRTLAGTLGSGEGFSVLFNGPLTLAPPVAVVPALPLLPALTLAVMLLVIGASMIRRQHIA
jgi:hypothetical protein